MDDPPQHKRKQERYSCTCRNFNDRGSPEADDVPPDDPRAQDRAGLLGTAGGAGPRRDLLPRAPRHSEGGLQGVGRAVLPTVFLFFRGGRRVEGGDAEDGELEEASGCYIRSTRTPNHVSWPSRKLVCFLA